MSNYDSYPDPHDVTPMFEGGTLLADRYRLLEKIGEGGAAEVFRAEDRRLDRVVAIKILRPQFTSDQQSRARFAVEAKAAAGLSHPNIVDVYDFGEAPDGAMFIVMQYIEGQNLREVLLERGRFSAAEAVRVVQQTCAALSLAHAKGLIHRDVKPQNIMLDTAGNVRLTDFGVVKALSSPGLTQSGMTFGTAAYLSPEQATGAPVGPPSDIYALGCVMYEMLSGRPPFEGDNPAVVAYKQVWEQPRPLHELAPEAPPSLEAVVMRCLDKEPDRRYPTTEALSAELDRLSLSFTQPTQAVIVPSSAGFDERYGEDERASNAQVSQPIPMPITPGGGPMVPPVKAQGTGAGFNGTPVPVAAPVPPTPRVAAAVPSSTPSTMAYDAPAQPAQRVQTVNVSDRRGLGPLPIALLAIVLLALCGLAAWQGRDFLPVGLLGGAGTGETPTATVTAAAQVPPPEPSPTPTLGQIVAGSPVTELPPTITPAPPTDTPVPPPPTDTLPPPASTDTPAPPAPAPTDTPAPPAPTDTPAPPPPPGPGTGSVTLDDTTFAGGYTRRDGLYHGRTAHWVYGQGTAYSTMTSSFNLDGVPTTPVNLTIEGVDSEDGPKTPMRLTINGTAIYEGPNPLPNDDTSGPGGPGNWGSYTWQFDPGLLQQGANTLTITNLDPSDRINYPIFIMVDYAVISW